MSDRVACPVCGTETWTYCFRCREYVTDLAAKQEAADTEAAAEDWASPPEHRVPDDRLEKEIEAACDDVWEALGFHVWRLSQPRASMQSPGIPDRLVTGHGLNVWVEVKRYRGRQSNAQRAFQAAVEANGGTYLLVRSEADVVRWWESVQRERRASA